MWVVGQLVGENRFDSIKSGKNTHCRISKTQKRYDNTNNYENSTVLLTDNCFFLLLQVRLCTTNWDFKISYNLLFE